MRLALIEALRLYPEPPILIRRALEEDHLPQGGSGVEGGVRLLKGTGAFDDAFVARHARLERYPSTHKSITCNHFILYASLNHHATHFSRADVFISTWSLHRSPELWEQPDQFMPDRWLRPMQNPGVQVRGGGCRCVYVCVCVHAHVCVRT